MNEVTYESPYCHLGGPQLLLRDMRFAASGFSPGKEAAVRIRRRKRLLNLQGHDSRGILTPIYC